MSSVALYPIKFKPILKQKVWGGDKLHKILNKEPLDNTGESWEVSGVPGSVSVVENGQLAGKDLQQLLEQFGPRLTGDRVYTKFGNTFPLLFKFIDAKEDLSVQLHPSDELAKERHQSFGKNEMWYIVSADRTSRLIIGFDRPMDRDTCSRLLEEGKLTQVLREVPVVEGSAFYISTGTVHAIGGGILLAEIQQSSDVTYRIYDWDRPGQDGKMRQLHTQEALDAIHFGPRTAELPYREELNTSVAIARSRYFNTDKLVLDRPYSISLKDRDSFTVFMCVGGAAKLRSNTAEVDIRTGETVLLPAELEAVAIATHNCVLLDISIP
jgi:mannose-6-phosphate isomerase